LRRSRVKEDRMKRENRLTLMLNNRELRALNLYCQRFRVTNRSAFMREAVMTAILKRFDSESPSLFEDGDPSLFREENKLK
jgi:hypothetical protein